MECGFAGNPDVYGIGIRIGYYTQALAVWFANYFHFREAKVLRSVNNLFLIALTIVGIVYFNNARDVYAVEAFLLLYLGITVAVISMLDGSRFTSRYTETSNERMISKMLIYITGQIFSVYFWWTALDTMRPTPCHNSDSANSNLIDPRKGTYGFFLVPANMYGWLRTLMRVVSVIELTKSALVLSSSEPVKVLQSGPMRKTKAAFIEAAAAQTQNSTAWKGAEQETSERIQHPQDRLLELQIIPGNTNTESGSEPSAATTVSHQLRGPVHIPHVDNIQSLSFSAVYEAEQYLESIFALCQMPKALLGHKRVVSIWKGYVRFYVPVRRTSQKSELVPLHKCFHMCFMWYGINKVSLNLRWRFHIHLEGLDDGPFFIWPRLLYRTIQLSNDNKPPSWKWVAIASDIQLSQITLKKSPKLWTFTAVKNLLLIILFITQVELTIVWNHVSGLNNLTSLGQLIPFILGVGGLLKVLWSKWRLVRSGIREDSKSSCPPPTDYETAIEAYLQWKKLIEGQTASRLSVKSEQAGPMPVAAEQENVPTHTCPEGGSSSHNTRIPHLSEGPMMSPANQVAESREVLRLTKRSATN